MEYRVRPIKGGCDAGDCASPDMVIGDDDNDEEDVVPLTTPGQIQWAKRPYDMCDELFLPIVLETLTPLSNILELNDSLL